MKRLRWVAWRREDSVQRERRNVSGHIKASNQWLMLAGASCKKLAFLIVIVFSNNPFAHTHNQKKSEIEQEKREKKSNNLF